MSLISRSLVAVGLVGGALLCPAQAQVTSVADAMAPKTVTTAWTTFKGDDQRTGASNAQVSLPLSLQWRYSSVGPARTYTTAPLVLGAPGNQRVIFAAGGTIYALDTATGQQSWKSAELRANVIVPLTLLSTETGDIILAMQTSGRLAALNAATGGVLWETDTGSLATESGPIVATTNNGPRIISALNTGRLVAVEPSGAIDKSWTAQLGKFGVSAASSMSLSPDGSRLFILGSDARLYIIDVKAARILYSLPQASRSGVTPAVYGDTVYTANARRVAAWKIGDGSPSWTFAPQGDVIGSPALMSDDKGGATLFVGTRDGQFAALDAATGKVKWQQKLPQDVSLSGSPLVLKNVVIVGTSNGLLVGFNPADGAIVWQYRLQTERVADLRPRAPRFQNTAGEGGAPDAGVAPTQRERTYGVSSAPAAIDGKVFVIGDNAALYAFTAQPFDADPPRIVEPSVAVNATDRQLLALLLSPDTPQVVPGVGPFYFATQIDDVGSGVDPNSISVSINDVPVEKPRVYFGVATSVLTVTLVDTAKQDPALTDGLKKIVITASDYAGNKVTFNTSFLVDNTVPPPTPPVDVTAPGGFEGGPPPGGFGP